MRAVSYGALFIAKRNIRMMILLMYDLCNDIYKCHGLVIILKIKGMTDAVFCGL